MSCASHVFVDHNSTFSCQILRPTTLVPFTNAIGHLQTLYRKSNVPFLKFLDTFHILRGHG